MVQRRTHMKNADRIRSKKRAPTAKNHKDDEQDIPKDKLDTGTKPTWQISTKQMKTVRKIYKEPTLNDIRWSNVVSLFRHLKFTLEQGMGSRVNSKERQGCLDATVHIPASKCRRKISRTSETSSKKSE